MSEEDEQILVEDEPDVEVSPGVAEPGSSGANTQGVTSPELWYSNGDLLVYIALSKEDGTIESMVTSTIRGLPVGSNGITMMPDGSLLGVRTKKKDGTAFYRIAKPPRTASDVTPEMLGDMPDGLLLEGLYTDCDGRLYAMDSGRDVTSSAGNRLLRIDGDLQAGDFAYEVITDLAGSSVTDIDDMGPGIALDGSTITDNPGLAIDTGSIYDFSYTEGTGTLNGKGGTWAIHALGGLFFADNVARVFVMDTDAGLFLYDSKLGTQLGSIGVGPEPTPGTTEFRGDSGLTGPITDCVSAFPPSRAPL
jgi:hypothetical protein